MLVFMTPAGDVMYNMLSAVDKWFSLEVKGEDTRCGPNKYEFL